MRSISRQILPDSSHGNPSWDTVDGSFEINSPVEGQVVEIPLFTRFSIPSQR